MFLTARVAPDSIRCLFAQRVRCRCRQLQLPVKHAIPAFLLWSDAGAAFAFDSTRPAKSTLSRPAATENRSATHSTPSTLTSHGSKLTPLRLLPQLPPLRHPLRLLALKRTPDRSRTLRPGSPVNPLFGTITTS
jgi:hypothetical protein